MSKDLFYLNFNIANCKGFCEFLNPSEQKHTPTWAEVLKKLYNNKYKNNNNNNLKYELREYKLKVKFKNNLINHIQKIKNKKINILNQNFL